MTHQEELDQLCINTLRTLAMDGVQKANSGHPGLSLIHISEPTRPY